MVHRFQEEGLPHLCEAPTVCQAQPRARHKSPHAFCKGEIYHAALQSLESTEVKSILFKEMAEPELYLDWPDPETHVLCTTPYPLTLWCLVLSCPHGTQETETSDSDLDSCHKCFPKWAFVFLRTVLTLPGSLRNHLREVFCSLRISPHSLAPSLGPLPFEETLRP